jgi:cytochrome c oxidase subunit 2
MNSFPELHLGMIDGVMNGASRIAPAVDAIFWSLTLTCTAVALAVGSCAVWFLVRYRQGSGARRPRPRWPEWRWESLWIGGTLVVFLGFYWAGARVYLRLEEPPPDAVAVDVVGRQWMWDIRHADGRREFNTLHVPVGQAILLRLSSEDVIHSFAVPAFRLKQDVVPGKTTIAWFEATRPGRFRIYCDQYCGASHSEMNGEVVVETPADFAGWVAQAENDRAPGLRGQRLFTTYGCAACHAGTDAGRAPSLTGLAGRMVTLSDGARVPADDAYLRESILSPAARIVAGYHATMPAYDGVLAPTAVADLIAYLHQLRTPVPRVASSP